MKKILFSGIQPSGEITLGNYLGAILNWTKLHKNFLSIFCIVNMHAITLRQEPSTLIKRTLKILAQYIACGLDPEKDILFVQSHVSEHAELAWILNCHCSYGELSRMTQFKHKKYNNNNINIGLFDYPVLMAADILLYNTNIVPIGHDQIQHLELTRNIAVRMNNIYNDNIFTIPEPYISKIGSKIMSLTDPIKKMSKSDKNKNSYILLDDTKDEIILKFKKSVTDNDSKVKFEQNKHGINNLMTIYSLINNKSIIEVENEFINCSYKIFKERIAESIIEHLAPIQKKTNQLLNNQEYLINIYKKNALKAQEIASITMKKISDKIGYIKK